MSTLLVLAANVFARPLRYVACVYLGLIWIGSIHFGWHYAIDGPIAVLMMLAVWRLAGWLARKAYPESGDTPATGPDTALLDVTPSAPLHSASA